jgi:sterol desaturase/sphingolipid hydroxylase (fatty acid hydroxylase superfamily)
MFSAAGIIATSLACRQAARHHPPVPAMLAWIALHPALAVMALLLAFAAAEFARGTWRSAHATAQDAPLEGAITLLFAAGIYPGILWLVGTLGHAFVPALAGRLAHWPGWAMFVGLLLADDFTQYWWHRASHTPLLWPLHRAHHSAPHMGVRVVYRNNAFYYALMPGLWLSSALVFLGFGPVYPWYVLLKSTVLFGSHSELRWDRVLYRHRWLHPLAWVVERTISTPATHFAHHALSNDDGIGHYKGNFGNLLFVWDVLFGTARITRRYPPRFGLRDDVEHGPERWWVQLLFPLVRSRRAQSALARRATIVG